jgi:hypothetical protein
MQKKKAEKNQLSEQIYEGTFDTRRRRLSLFFVR